MFRTAIAVSVLLLAAAAASAQPVIQIGDGNSSTTDLMFSSDYAGSGMSKAYFDIVMANPGGLNYGGVGLAAQLSGTALSYLTPDASFMTLDAETWKAVVAAEGGATWAWYKKVGLTQYFGSNSTSNVFPVGSDISDPGSFWTFGIASSAAKVTTVTSGMVIARFVFDWDGVWQPTPGVDSLYCTLIRDSGVDGSLPDLFQEDGTTGNIGFAPWTNPSISNNGENLIVPEPTTLGLLGLGLAAIAARRRKNRV